MPNTEIIDATEDKNSEAYRDKQRLAATMRALQNAWSETFRYELDTKAVDARRDGAKAIMETIIRLCQEAKKLLEI